MIMDGNLNNLLCPVRVKDAAGLLAPTKAVSSLVNDHTYLVVR
jgi:hypothetical protein